MKARGYKSVWNSLAITSLSSCFSQTLLVWSIACRMCTAREFKRTDKSRWGKCEQQNCQMSYRPKRHACAVLTDRLQLEEFKYCGELVWKQNQKLARRAKRGPPLTRSSNKGSTETLHPERVVIQYDCHEMVQICPRYQKLTRLKQDCALACLATRTDLTGSAHSANDSHGHFCLQGIHCKGFHFIHSN